ncbi:fibronectin type III domain-containing protein [Streptomyces odontomachi]|uniref:fibronectin type III domain-containing protein n=1 Tax=Streptomyces odontomachi TaxID=2944940 RepID=UPI00210E7863|nr:fibronectin type III domain-containing protein [Streptomyces sp. ODS25]
MKRLRAAATSAAVLASLALAAPAAMAGTSPADASSLMPPTNLHVVGATDSDILLKWDPSADKNASYQVYLDDNPTPLTYGQAATEYDVQFNRAVGLIPGSTHTFFVRAYDGSQTADSAPVTGTFAPGDNTPPSAPTNLHVVRQDSSGFTVAWDASDDESDVQYFLSGVPCSPRSYIGGTSYGVSSLQFDPVCGVSPGTYTIAVRARDAWDNDSGYSEPITVDFTG